MTLSDERLAELKRIAEKATPGPWRSHNDGPGQAPSARIRTLGRRQIAQTAPTLSAASPDDFANAEFIAAANPQTVLALVAAASHSYDSRPDTWEHISRVRRYIDGAVKNLIERGDRHDRTKLAPPEVELFDVYTPLLRDTTYGSPEYKTFLEEMAVALRHHYDNNTHHPEHYKDGIGGMTLLDLVEMLCDWKAATERHADGDIARSIEQNQERFGYSDELRAIFDNTRREFGW